MNRSANVLINFTHDQIADDLTWPSFRMGAPCQCQSHSRCVLERPMKYPARVDYALEATVNIQSPTNCLHPPRVRRVDNHVEDTTAIGAKSVSSRLFICSVRVPGAAFMQEECRH